MDEPRLAMTIEPCDLLAQYWGRPESCHRRSRPAHHTVLGHFFVELGAALPSLPISDGAQVQRLGGPDEFPEVDRGSNNEPRADRVHPGLLCSCGYAS